jgi:methylenetetrahydrofolate--tRNA-(uracil-5-)-methyltransferase
MPQARIHIIGGGLAGSEAAWQAARLGVPVVLHEMRPERQTEAHKSGGMAELVCSNSFRSDDAASNAVGLLHEEMRRASSLIMAAGDAHKLPAGGALAVDREGFSNEDAATRSASARHHRARRGGLPAAAGLEQRHHRHRAAHLAGTLGRHSTAHG